MKRLASLSAVLAILAAVMLAVPSGPASSQQAQAPKPVGGPVTEEQLLQKLRQVDGRISLPDERASVLEQPQGRDWRIFRESTLQWVGSIVLVGMIVVLAAFYLWRGRIRVRSGFSGIHILRFSAFERFMHWMTAGCFVVLGITGLNVTFGKWAVLPFIGNDGFTTVTIWGKYAHNYLAWPFMLGLLMMLVVWIKDNIPDRIDWNWLKRGGGLFDDSHPPAERFNAGQKLIFWTVIVGGAVLSASGLMLLFPFALTGIAGMQSAEIAHALAGVVMIAIIVAHIYIGTLGMEGAFEAMGSGEVDLNWAKEHHALWVDKEKVPATAPGQATVPAE